MTKRKSPIQLLREEMGLSQEAFAARLGLKSKGQICDLERLDGKRPSIRVALEIEKLSEGRLRAADLNPDVALVIAHVAANDASAQDAAA